MSIVIPVYNEENTLMEILQWVKEEPHEKEIIIVDDCSTDGTKELLCRLEGEDNITIIYQTRNKGKGAAIREGFKHVSGDIVIIQDADLEYYPDEYQQLIKPIVDGKADVVYGSRFLGSHRAYLFWHYLGNKTINLIANIILNTCLTDMMTCYKAFKTSVLRSLELHANRFGIEPEITAEIFKKEYRVYEVPISYNARDYYEGKKIKWTDFFKCCYWLLKAYLRKGDVGRDTLLKMRVMKNNNNWVFERLKPYIGKRTLEMGSGIGTFSQKIVRETNKLIASDINHDYINLLSSKFSHNHKVVVKKIDATKADKFVPQESIDTVVSLNIMEHVEDDSSMLKSIYTILQNNGRLLLLVPAHQFLYGSLDHQIGHCRRYNKVDLTQKLKRAGFEIEKIEFMNMFSAVGWLLNFKIMRRSTMPLSTIRTVDKFIPLIKSIERRLQPKFGLSVYAVARKRNSVRK